MISCSLFSHINWFAVKGPTQLREETIQLFPEEINNDPSSSPSKRIISKLPNYDKVVNGVSVTKAIGVDTLCNACPHFKEWIDTLKTRTV